MSRRPTYPLGTIVTIDEPTYAVVIDRWQKYLLTRCDSMGRLRTGIPTWRLPREMTPTGRMSVKPAKAYRKFLNSGGLEMLGCACLCCGPHYGGMVDD